MVMVLASSGADVSDGVASLHGWGRAARALAECSGMVPVVVVVTGPALSGPALLLGLADLVIMTTDAFAFVSGPAMVEDFTGMRIGIHQLGGTAMHARSSGLCAIEAASEEDAMAHVGPPVEPAPGQRRRAGPARTCQPVRGDRGRRRSCGRSFPTRATSSYDVRRVAAALADDQDVTELWTRWSPQLVTALGRIGGRTGRVRGQPAPGAGRHPGHRRVAEGSPVRPLLRRVQPARWSPWWTRRASCPGKDLEWRGMIRHGAELAFAYAEATVPRVCVILRKAFGGAYIVMDSKGLGNDLCFAWPGAEIAVMGAEGAVQILNRRARSRGAGGPPGRVRRAIPHPVAGGRAGVRRRGDRPRGHPSGGGRGARHSGDRTGAAARAQAHGGAAVERLARRRLVVPDSRVVTGLDHREIWTASWCLGDSGRIGMASIRPTYLRPLCRLWDHVTGKPQGKDCRHSDDDREPPHPRTQMEVRPDRHPHSDHNARPEAFPALDGNDDEGKDQGGSEIVGRHDRLERATRSQHQDSKPYQARRAT